MDDIIRGGQSDDVITGLQGNGYLEGGLGKDQFIFGIGKPFDSVIGLDTILDFNAADDKIILEKTTFSALGTQVSFASVNTL
ncbi:hypothetical protein WA1_34865 [Scytonema hofmannii PCC 7110]|uniref:Peptidase M10 serralysin C-terminal domain-containing protein n=1 Tax=Scytonema hofmannii PCC 7110 TaxID=128403 RepID=A0A139X257_9CYAN|nr:hypothetical protein WA1_34865 [Scytonema hofmannii PCC 7110]